MEKETDQNFSAKLFNYELVTQYKNYLINNQIPPTTIRRYLTTLNRLQEFIKPEPDIPNTDHKLSKETKEQLYTSNNGRFYFTTALLILIFILFSFLGYKTAKVSVPKKNIQSELITSEYPGSVLSAQTNKQYF